MDICFKTFFNLSLLLNQTSFHTLLSITEVFVGGGQKKNPIEIENKIFLPLKFSIPSHRLSSVNV